MAETLAPKPDESFKLAMRAFDLMTLPERLIVMEWVAQLRYPSVTDRFFEAVHRVVTREKDGDSGNPSKDAGLGEGRINPKAQHE